MQDTSQAALEGTEADASCLPELSTPQSMQQSAASKDKKALGVLLRAAAKQMQQQEGALDEAVTGRAATVVQQVEAQQESAPQNGDPPADAEDNSLDSAVVGLSSLSQTASDSSSTGLLPPEPSLRKAPTRGVSLGEKLGSMLRNALSLPRQGSYAPVSTEDGNSEDGLAQAVGKALEGSSTQRALPRDASYLPEWLNRTLRKKSSSSARSGSFSRQTGVSRAGSALPEWVDGLSLQQSQLSDATLSTIEAPHTASHDTQQQQQQQQQKNQSLPELFTKALKPVPRPAPTPEPHPALFSAPSWPPTEAQTAIAAARESRGKRLLAFWQQAAAAATSEMSSTQSVAQSPAAAAVGQKPAVNQTPVHAVHACSRAMLDSGLQSLNSGGPQLPQASQYTLLSSAPVVNQPQHCMQHDAKMHLRHTLCLRNETGRPMCSSLCHALDAHCT